MKIYTFGQAGILECIKIPSTVKSLGPSALMEFTKLKEVEHCEGLEIIQRERFSGYSCLECFKILSTVKSLGVSTFAHCTHLTELELYKGLKKIGGDLFSGCSSLECISIHPQIYTYRTLKNYQRLASVKFHETIDMFVPAVSMRELRKNGISLDAFVLCQFFMHCNTPN